jgi:hypothetical protein
VGCRGDYRGFERLSFFSEGKMAQVVPAGYRGFIGVLYTNIELVICPLVSECV